MAGVAAGLLLLGLFVFVVGLIFLLLAVGDFRARRRVRRVGVLTCAEALQRASAGRARVCAVQGYAAPGPAGPLIAPASGEECVWYFTRVRQHYYHRESEPRSFDTVWVDARSRSRFGTGPARCWWTPGCSARASLVRRTAAW